MSSSGAIIPLHILFSKYFNEEDVSYLLPLLVKWAGSEEDVISWFKEQPIPALGDKTGLDMCKTSQAKCFIDYVQAMELGGFA